MAKPEITGRFILLFDSLLNNKPHTQNKARKAIGMNTLRIDPDKRYDTHAFTMKYLAAIEKQWFGSKDTVSMLTREILPLVKRTTDQLKPFSSPIPIFQALDPIYKANNRGDGIGGYECTEVTDSYVVMKSNDLASTVAPSYNLGIYEGTINIFEPEYRFDRIETLQLMKDKHSHSIHKIHFHRG